MTKPLVICAPEPRSIPLIFLPEQEQELRARYELFEVAENEVDDLTLDVLARA